MKINNLNQFLLQRVRSNVKNIPYRDNYIVDRTRLGEDFQVDERMQTIPIFVDLEWVKSLYFKIVCILSTFCIIS